MNPHGALPNLDALRAVAVLLVLADHVLETVAAQEGGSFHPLDRNLGRMGVLLFFVHTCFVLMASLERLGATGWMLARDFYVRRAFRLYPLAIVCVLGVVIAGIPAKPWESFRFPETFDLASNLLLVTNLTDSPEVIAPLWTLPVEVQMYLLLPAIFLAASRDLARLAAIYLLSLATALVLPRLSPVFSMMTYAPCFLAGVIAHALYGRMRACFPAWTWLPFIGVMVFAYLALERATGDVHDVFAQAAICLAVGLAIPAFAQSSSRALNLAAHLVAKYSYGIYLFNLPAIWLAWYVLPIESHAIRGAVALAVLASVSIGFHHALEAPMIRAGAWFAARTGGMVLRQRRS